MNPARLLSPLLHLCVLWSFSLSVTSFASAANPERLWLVPLAEGETLEAAWEAGATILDQFPRALLVADEASAKALSAAGFHIEGPVSPDMEKTVVLLRPRLAGARSAATEPSEFPLTIGTVANTPGVDLLWSDGRNMLVQADTGWEAAPAILDLERQVLSTRPLQPPRVPALPRRFELPSDILEPIEFAPGVDAIVAEAELGDYFQWIRNLSGADTVLIGDQSFRFMTRYTHAWHCDKAEQYVYERFLDMGYTSVEYDEYMVGGSLARNVIATLPGTETPEQIYILCGHLDSISEDPMGDAPGANDNASGTAIVLAAAEILKDYEFRSTIKFCAFTGEELGLYGSGHYAGVAQAAGDNIRGVVNCDMVAYWDDDYGILIQGPRWCALLMHVMEEACIQYTGLGTQIMYAAWGSDHVSFLRSGYPAFLAIELDYHSYPHYHRTTDFAHHNSGVFGTDVLRASLATIAQRAGVIGPRPEAVAVAEEVALPIFTSAPNPFAEETALEFSLNTPGPVSISVYDIAGRLVRQLVDETRLPGTYRTEWDGRDQSGQTVSDGVYFSRLVTEGTVHTWKLSRVIGRSAGRSP